ncbi:MAG: hypothetical protein F4X82_01775 [Candidatus Spechtbacteria bacterium SB0662_bin_43]|uniref:Uncharacterized protein n=1 Tax=Candidatus Spechtbacteria bacterium SB0662_bin_43 TaxID=2604897 RepID=A0A845DE41_9BACT|nr:hypothetical protein [Candidatus Spechtbacteria bacterium SB0662_bin_43]
MANQTINVQFEQNPTDPTDVSVSSTGEWDVGGGLGDGGIIAFMDEYSAQHLNGARYQWRWHNDVRAQGKAKVLDNKTSYSLKPTAIKKHIWNNLYADVSNTFNTQLEQSTTLEQSSSMTTSLDIADSLEVDVEAKGAVFSAGAKNTVSVSVSKSKTYSNSETKTLGSTDGLSTTLPPHTAEVVVLSALTGNLTLTTRVQTYWDGAIDYRYMKDGKWTEWETIQLADVEVGLARPLDEKGVHDGLVTVTSTFGSAGEVDQSARSISSLSETDVDNAVNGILEDRAKELGLGSYTGTVVVKRSLIERLKSFFLTCRTTQT